MPPTFLRRPSSGTGRPPRPTLTSAFASAFLTLSCAGLIATQAPTPARAAAPDFIAFESGHVRPLALSADGTKLFAVNTPNNTLEVFNVTPAGLQLAARVPVLEAAGLLLVAAGCCTPRAGKGITTISCQTRAKHGCEAKTTPSST